MKRVYKDFQELYATLRGRVVEIKPKEFVPKKVKAEPKEEPKAEPKPKKSRKKKEEK